MSSRARRLSQPRHVERFDWGLPPGEAPSDRPAIPPAPPSAPEPSAAPVASERDGFLLGYAQGEKAGAEAAAKRAEGMLRRLKETLEELTTLRAEMLQRTERQIVQLALAIARRIVRRETSLDPTLLVGMARAALDRLGEQASATIRLHPDDYAAAAAGLPSDTDTQVHIVADPFVSRGSCLVESDFGFMDVSPEAQLDELARALLEDGQPAPEGAR